MFELLLVILLTCCVHLNAAPVEVEESGPWCDLTDRRVNASGRIICRFNEDVENAQLDFYAQNGTGLPEIAVTCFTSCEVANDFRHILDLENMEDARTLSLSFQTLSPGVVGRYRCQASSVSTQNNVQGNCSLQLANIKVGLGPNDYSDDDTPSEEEEEITYYFYFFLLIIVVIAAVAIPLVICKKKACGIWKKRENIKSDIYKDPSVSFHAFSVSEPSSPTTYKEHLEDNDGSGEQELHVDDSEDTDDEDPLTREDGPEYDQPSDADSSGGGQGTSEGLKVPMMDRVRSEFAASHSPATCKKRTMLRHELHRKFEEEKKRSVKK